MSNRYGSIYLVTNLKNKKKYVGLTTTTIEERWYHHCALSTESYLNNSINKHGLSNFKIEEICSALNKEDLEFMECFFIIHYNSHADNGQGYNLTSGGSFGGKQSIITCEKKSQSTKLWWDMNECPEKYDSRMKGIKTYISEKKRPVVSVDISTKEIARHDYMTALSVNGADVHQAIDTKSYADNKYWFDEEDQSDDELLVETLRRINGFWQYENIEPVIATNIRNGEVREYPNIYAINDIPGIEDIGTVRKIINQELNYFKNWTFRCKADQNVRRKVTNKSEAYTNQQRRKRSLSYKFKYVATKGDEKLEFDCMNDILNHPFKPDPAKKSGVCEAISRGIQHRGYRWSKVAK